MHDEKEQGIDQVQQMEQHQALVQQAEEHEEQQSDAEAGAAEETEAWFDHLRQQNSELMAAKEQEQREQDVPER